MEKDIKLLKVPKERKALSFTERKALSFVPNFPSFLPMEISEEIARGGLPNVNSGGLKTWEMKETLFEKAILPNLTSPMVRTDLTPLLLKYRKSIRD